VVNLIPLIVHMVEKANVSVSGYLKSAILAYSEE